MLSWLMRIAFAVLLALVAAPVFAPASANEDDAARYETCLLLVETDPQSAFDSAALWEREGGGAPARHCAAVAMTALGRYGDAGRMLEAIANSTAADDTALRADLFGQAGNAWLLAGDAGRAASNFTAALLLAPDDVALYIDRARAMAMMGDLASAETDLSAAIARNPQSYTALTLRAAARRQTGNIQGALEDCNAALFIFPNGAEALTERGLVHALEGRRDEARADFLAAINAGGPAADAARDALALLDVDNAQ